MFLKWLGAIPWIALLGGMPLLNRSEPLILGLPLPLAWAVACTLMSSLVLAIVFLLDPANHVRGGRS